MIGLLIDLVSSLFGNRKEKALAKVVACIKHQGFAESVRAHAQRQSSAPISDADWARVGPITRPLFGDLVVAYAHDGPANLNFIGQDFLDSNKLSRDELHQAALANSRSRISKNIQPVQLRNFIGLEAAMPGIASSTVLFPEFWKSFEKKYACDLLVTVPGRDFVALMAVPANGPEREVALVRSLIMKNAAIAAFEESGNHALSEYCFRVRNGTFEVQEQLGEQSPECAALLATARGEALLAECGVGEG